jgi:shikimate kinase
VLSAEQNIVLVGMPGVGKSTVGVLLAKATSRDFCDTDVWIQSRERRTLQQMLDREGAQRFCQLEEQHILALTCRGHVIATGGSVVYSRTAMQHLAESGMIVHLDLPLPTLDARLTNMAMRGVVMAESQSLAQLHSERTPLYRQYANLALDTSGLNQDQVVSSILRMLTSEDT